MAVVRAERAHEQNLRKIASSYSKEIRNFWTNVDKLFQFGVQTQVEQKRKQARDQHLNFIVDKTEKFSTMLAESMMDTAANSSLRTTPNVSDAEMDNEDEYEPDQDSDDDERTIAKDEDRHEEGEIDDLEAEADIPLEELLKKFHPELFEKNNTDVNKASSPEKKISKEESLGKRRRSSRRDSGKPTDVNTSDNEKEAEKETTAAGSEAKESEVKPKKDLQDLMGEGNKDFYDVVEMAAKFQPTGNTLDTTSVKTPVPFLLKHTLREYQHIGLDWLVSLHERKLNGILADEMGLGKTIQTIALLAHLACERHVWGPHLIVVPTSVMLNWEMEIKKWAPAFKVLTYYGTQKERKLKRVGWTKPNAFHVCITSYKLVTQDHSSFRRKQWQYLILDEAQHIKNFKSQRWQLLLNFPSEGRLLLTGTPLQNNLMELWSLMHFLMPNVFESHRDFKEWFSNPLTGMVEGSSEYNEDLIQRLHKVLRPFLLRRLKNEVEKQLPKKYEHVVKCPLSKRQRFLYDDFMSRAKTRETLESGNLLSVINVLMQLRKVCNHPNLFEPRPTLSPFVLDSVQPDMPVMFQRALMYEPLKEIDLSYSPLAISNHEFHLTAFQAHRHNRLRCPRKTVETCVLFKGQGLPVPCPPNRLRMTVKPSAPPSIHPTHHSKTSLQALLNNNQHFKARMKDGNVAVPVRTPKGTYILCPRSQIVALQQKQQLALQPSPPPAVTTLHMQVEPTPSPKEVHVMLPSPPKRQAVESSEEKDKDKMANGTTTIKEDNNSMSMKRKKEREVEAPKIPPKGIFSSKLFKEVLQPSPMSSPTKEGGGDVSPRRKRARESFLVKKPLQPPQLVKDRLVQNLMDKVECIMSTNNRRCNVFPLYGKDLVSAARVPTKLETMLRLPEINGRIREDDEEFGLYDMQSLVPSTISEVMWRLRGFTRRFNLYVEPCTAVEKYATEMLLETTETLQLDTDEVTNQFQRLAKLPLLQLPETR